MEKEELIKKARTGDEEAFVNLMYDIRFDLYKIARVRLSCDADIEDAIQETAFEIYRSIRKLRNEKSFMFWVIKILINKCNKIYKYNLRSKISYENLEMDNFITDNTDNYTEDDAEFYYLLEGLNYEERLSILLFYMEDYSIKQISRIMNVNENTVKTRLKRAKDKIKEKYESIL